MRDKVPADHWHHDAGGCDIYLCDSDSLQGTGRQDNQDHNLNENFNCMRDREALLWIKQWVVIESYHHSFLFSNLSHHTRNISPSGLRCEGLEWSSVLILTMGRLVVDVKWLEQKVRNNFIYPQYWVGQEWLQGGWGLTETDWSLIFVASCSLVGPLYHCIHVFL